MEISKQEFHAKLPARITGVVFWGLVLFGLIGAVVILDHEESRLLQDNKRNAQFLASEIEEILEAYADPQAVINNNGRLKLALRQNRLFMGYSSVTINEGDQSITSGVRSDDDDLYRKTIHYYPRGSSRSQTVEVSVFYPNQETAIANIRKNVLLTVGISVFIFGLLLQRILFRVLSHPFLDMVTTAQRFTDGDKEIRFNATRQDEFGYLGGFINEAVTDLLNHQKDLNDALVRVGMSERELKHEKERAEVTLTSITDAVITVDTEARIQFINPSAESLIGVTLAEVENRPFEDVVNLVNEITGEPLPEPLRRCIDEVADYDLPEHSSLLNGDSVAIPIEASVAAMETVEGELMGAVIVIQDVSHTRKLTKQLSYQASHDMLTGLYNRRKFEEILGDALRDVTMEGKQHSFCYLDLDQFKIVNDTCGHVAGDELLRGIPELFFKVLRGGDIVARLGGDEFGILLENCGVDQAVHLAERIREEVMDFRFIWDDKNFDIGVSIGVVGITSENADMGMVMSAADVACYAAKDGGRNQVHVYEPSDGESAVRHGEMHWTSRIKTALEKNRFRLYRQPIIDITDNSEDHYEILLRMINDDGEVIPPGAFLPAAERYNLMRSIDRWVISEVFRYISSADQSDPVLGTNKVISINLSGDSITDDELYDFIIRRRDQYGITLDNICFEVTETVAISNLSKATEFITSLKAHGCRFSLDDFGSGLSSFAYLKNLPVDYLKIDGAFIKEINRDDIDRAMVTSISQIGEVMSLKTIAEKVENEETLSILRQIGINYAQGYHLGRPEAINQY